MLVDVPPLLVAAGGTLVMLLPLYLLFLFTPKKAIASKAASKAAAKATAYRRLEEKEEEKEEENGLGEQTSSPPAPKLSHSPPAPPKPLCSSQPPPEPPSAQPTPPPKKVQLAEQASPEQAASPLPPKPPSSSPPPSSFPPLSSWLPSTPPTSESAELHTPAAGMRSDGGLPPTPASLRAHSLRDSASSLHWAVPRTPPSPPRFYPMQGTFDEPVMPTRRSPMIFPDTTPPLDERTSRELEVLRQQRLVQNQFALPPATELPPPPPPPELNPTPPPSAMRVRLVWRPRKVTIRRQGESPRVTTYLEGSGDSPEATPPPTPVATPLPVLDA